MFVNVGKNDKFVFISHSGLEFFTCDTSIWATCFKRFAWPTTMLYKQEDFSLLSKLYFQDTTHCSSTKSEGTESV